MKCFICEEKEFSMILEYNKNIKDNPIIICYDCIDERKLTLKQCKKITSQSIANRCT